MEDLFERFFAKDYQEHQPGVAILVLINDQIVYQRCFGLANVERNERITPKTNFRLASLTKQFTARGIVLLEEQGRLSIQNTLGMLFPSSFTETCPTISKKVTIEHLLNHRSGIVDYEALCVTDQPNYQWTDEDVLQTITDQTYFEPGSEYRYSNTGYILLGLIIQRVSGQSLADFFNEHIFQPYGMKSSILPDSRKSSIDHRALGYIRRDEDGDYELCDQSATSGTGGDGGLYMSIEDYLQWYRHARSILPSTLGHVDTAKSTSYYQLGWFLADPRGQIKLHVGDSCGFTHQVFRIDENERRVLVLYLSNLGENQRRIEKFNRLIVDNFPELTPINTDLLWTMSDLTRWRRGLNERFHWSFYSHTHTHEEASINYKECTKNVITDRGEILGINRREKKKARELRR